MAAVEYKFEKLSARNYSTWKTVIRSQLMSKDLWQFVVESKNDTDDERIGNETAKHLMYVSMDAQQIASTGVCDSANDLWRKIKENHEGAESNLRSLSLSEFLGLKFRKNESLVSYAGRYELALGKLMSTGHVVDESTKLWVFSNSLPTHMKQTVHMFTMAHPSGTVAQLISQLKIQFHIERESSENNSAFYSNENNGRKNWQGSSKPAAHKDIPQRSGQNQQRASNPQGLQCTYCKIMGHSWKECRKLKADDERKKRFSQQRKNQKPSKPAQTPGSSAFLTKVHNFSNGKHTWIIDSGASKHMTRHMDFIKNYKPFEVPSSVTLGNGQVSFAYGSGNVPFKSGKYLGHLENVLWVPDLCENLFSVGQAMQLGCNFEFNVKGSEVLLKRGDKTVLKGSKRRDSAHFLVKLVPLHEETALVGATLEEWHRRLGHCSIETVRKLIRNNAAEGLQVTNKPDNQCLPCIMGKLCRAHHPMRDTIKANENSAILHIDTVGPMQIDSLGGARFFVLATEEFSGYMLIEFVGQKSSISDKIKQMINQAELECGRPIKAIYTDNGTEFANRNLNGWLRKRGILHVVSVAYTPEQNGRAERSNRTVLDGVRTLLSDSKLPDNLWAEAARTIVYTTNRLISSRNPDKTRFELFTGNKPKLDNLRIFGQKAITREPDQVREGKLSERGRESIFVGYTDRHNTHRFYVDEPHPTVFQACDARFLSEHRAGGEEQSEEFVPILINESRIVTGRSAPVEDAADPDYVVSDTDSSTYVSGIDNVSTESDAPTVVDEAVERRVTRAFARAQEAQTDKPPSSHKDGPSVIGVHEVALFTLDDEPRTSKDAKERDDWHLWKTAMDEEISALEKNKTWILVDKPANVRPIKNKWVYKIKLRPDGQVERYKARLVAKGFTQIENIDYKETYAPVASMTTVRMFLAVANQHDMYIKQFDVKTAFLYGDLDETLYMEQPEGYSTGPEKVCKLIKSIYGLKQAPRQWNKKFDSFLKLFNLCQAHVDKCLYFNEDRSLLLAIYVDDGLAAGRDPKLLDSLIAHLKTNFELKVMDCISYLGFQVKRDRKAGTLFVSQGNYVDRMLSRFKMDDCNPIETPEQVGVKFDNSPLLPVDNQFKELVGSLLYLATCSRPDISHAVSLASRTSEPTQAHWTALKRILRYLKGSRDLGLLYKRQNPVELVGYSDADYANDEKTRRSTTGLCIYFGGAPIAWRCQRQPIITLSTTEAEYVAGCELVKELLPLREQLIELRQVKETEPTTVLIDNQSTVRIATNESGQTRTKHIDIRHKWLTEQSTMKKIKVSHVSGQDQAADILTKPLYREKFLFNRSKLLTNAVAFMAVLTLCSSLSQATQLKMTDPLTTVASDVVYINGDTRFRLKNIFFNPCETLFNHSSSFKVTEILIRHCHDYYDRKVLRTLTACRRLPDIGLKLNQIPISSDCSETATDGQPAGKCTLSKRDPGKGGAVTDLDQIAETWNNHKKKVDALPVLRRNPRHPFFLLGTALISIFAMGTSSRSLNIANSNSKDIDQLTNVTNSHSELIASATEIIEFYKNGIDSISNWSYDVEQRLGNEQLGSRQYDDPIYRGKRANLVKHYMQWFEAQEKLLSEINHSATRKKAPSQLGSLLNITENYQLASNWSKLFECNYQLVNKSMVLDLDFILPVIDKEVEILSVLPMNFYNYPEGNETSTACWTYYVGPDLVLFNKTSGCLTRLNHDKVHQRSVRAFPCLEPLDDLHSNESINEIWAQENCTDTAPFLNKRIQIQEIDGIHKIYCHPFKIDIDGEVIQCPNGTFLIEGHRTYMIGNITHVGGLVDTTVTREIRSINTSQLLRMRRSSVDPPSLVAEPQAIVAVTGGPTIEPVKNITAHLKNITSRMDASIAKIKQKLKDLPTLNITRTEALDAFFWEPIDILNSGINAVGTYIKSLGFSFGLLGACMLLFLIMPAIEILFVAAKLIKIPINLWIGSAQRVSHRLSNLSNHKNITRMMPYRRRRWDDGFKIV